MPPPDGEREGARGQSGSQAGGHFAQHLLQIQRLYLRAKRSDGLAEGGVLDDAGPRAGGAVGAAEMPVGSGGQRTDDHAEPADSQQGQRHDFDRHHEREGERRRAAQEAVFPAGSGQSEDDSDRIKLKVQSLKFKYRRTGLYGTEGCFQKQEEGCRGGERGVCIDEGRRGRDGAGGGAAGPGARRRALRRPRDRQQGV